MIVGMLVGLLIGSLLKAAGTAPDADHAKRIFVVIGMAILLGAPCGIDFQRNRHRQRCTCEMTQRTLGYSRGDLN